MVWDFAIVYIAVALAIAGWNIGLRNSWPTPIAMFLATIAVQSSYVDFCAWVFDGTRLTADLAFFAGYIIFWLAAEFGLECALRALLPVPNEFTVSKASRAAAAVLGLAKAAVLVVFATAATVSCRGLPYPPSGAPIAEFLIDGAHGSIVLKAARVAAARLPEHVAQQVICWQGPSSRPTFRDGTAMRVDREKAEKYREMFTELRNLEQTVSNL